MQPLRVALVQLRSTADAAASVADAQRLARDALAAGAQLVVLPENYSGMGSVEERVKRAYQSDAPQAHPAIAPFLELTSGGSPGETPGPCVILGGTPELAPDGRVFNTLLALRGGRVISRYRKIHLFDADLRDGTRLAESAHTAHGDEVRMLRLPEANIGLSICYDLRFPELYRALSAAGAEILVVPAAFTAATGPAHWEVLLRARAIENQCFVLAAAQHGDHGNGRRSHGDSMVIDPWGTIVARLPADRGILVSDLDPESLHTPRTRLPSLTHRRFSPDWGLPIL